MWIDAKLHIAVRYSKSRMNGTVECVQNTDEEGMKLFTYKIQVTQSHYSHVCTEKELVKTSIKSKIDSSIDNWLTWTIRAYMCSPWCSISFSPSISASLQTFIFLSLCFFLSFSLSLFMFRFLSYPSFYLSFDLRLSSRLFRQPLLSSSSPYYNKMPSIKLVHITQVV